MKVYALVGKSGTGKSHHSMRVAREHQLGAIVDDGLLIYENRILAGRSAKGEKNKLASVRRAIFNDPAHAKEVRQSLAEHNIDSLLIIGTSEKMVKQIAETLKIGPIDRTIFIEEVATAEEIAEANRMRGKHGKHVIPVPTFEVKRRVPGYLLDPLLLWFKKKGQQDVVEEKTVMRPAYSYLGEFKISPKAIEDLCAYEIGKIPSMHKFLHCKSIVHPDGGLLLEIDVIMHFPCRVSEQANLAAKQIQKVVGDMTGMDVRGVQIRVKSLQMDNRGK